MPNWAGKWQGGRYYIDEQGRQVFFLERWHNGRSVSRKLKTHDPRLAVGELARFENDRDAYLRPPPPEAGPLAPVTITADLLKLYMASIQDCARDYRAAKRSDLLAWSDYRDASGKPLDLRTADKRSLRLALASFSAEGSKDKRRTGGFKRRCESLNCFANWLVQEGDAGLKEWSPLRPSDKQKPAKRRAERIAYTLEEVEECWRRVQSQPVRDVLMIRASTGMHHTEIEQLEGCKIYTASLPDVGVGIRKLKDEHEIRGVLQVRQKTKPRHRVSVNQQVLDAALRLQASGVPSRKAMWTALDPLIPSNLRHTWVTLCGEVGEEVSYINKGIPLDRIQAIGGHRIGSAITELSYDKLQVPPMSKLPFNWA